MHISYGRGRGAERVADRGCEFFRPPSNELVLRKAAQALVELGPQIERKESEQASKKRERKREREEERCLFVLWNVASLGLIIKNRSRYKAVKENYQLLKIKGETCLIFREGGGGQARESVNAQLARICIKRNKDNRYIGCSKTFF